MAQIVLELPESEVANAVAVADAQRITQEDVLQHAVKLGLSLLMARTGVGGLAASQAALEAGFGVWKDCPDAPADSLAYQIAVRAEWP